MNVILVTETTSTIDGRSMHNRVAWRNVNGERTIIAIGAAEEWNSPASLPPTAIVTDLVAASVDDSSLARALWGPFLSYLASASNQRPALPRLIRPARSVLIKIPDNAVASAVSTAIQKTRGLFRFKVDIAT